ncbi:MAG: SPOR domain-containing protein [Armatimonadetes bacterium]|nr:SPOR domain-containing protein [Armatimonadota bacterium]
MITGANPYKVQVGGFGQRAEAERLAEDLRSKGYEVFITQERQE